MKKSGPTPIADVLSDLMARRGYARVQTTATYDEAWQEAAGELISEYTRVGTVRRGTLEVLVANSTLMQELTFQKPQLIKILGQLLPDQDIKDLRFRIGNLD